MEVEVSGLGIGLILLAIGLTLMGYFVGKGLQNMGHPDKGHNYNLFIKESDLEFYLNLDKNEIEELLRKYPNAPKIEIKGTTYYPHKQFMDWVSSNEFYK
ncbi:DNA-binding protein [Virgibacillus ainsalahensis]